MACSVINDFVSLQNVHEYAVFDCLGLELESDIHLFDNRKDEAYLRRPIGTESEGSSPLHYSFGYLVECIDYKIS